MPNVRTSHVAVLAMLLGTTHAVVAGAQTRAKAPASGQWRAIELATMEHVKRELLPGELGANAGAGSVVFDRRIGHPAGYLTKGRGQRSTEHAQQLASTLGAKVVDGDSTLGCRDETDAGTCHLEAHGPALLRVGAPTVRHDSAFTTVTLLRGVDQGSEPIASVVYHLVLVRSGHTWHVVPNHRLTRS